MATQNTVSQPLRRRMKTGSPCTDAQRLFAVFTTAAAACPTTDAWGGKNLHRNQEQLRRPEVCQPRGAVSDS